MGLTRGVYNLIFKRNSTFLLTVVVGAMFFERALDQAVDYAWERHNQGVIIGILNIAHYYISQKLWMHIKHNYESPGAPTDEE